MDDSELRTQLERHHAESYGWALGCCRRNPDDAESVLQSAYLKVLEGKARFDGRAAFKTWLFAVIRKTALDKRRKQFFRGIRFVSDTGASERVHLGNMADEMVYLAEMQSLFREALSHLPKRQREVLQLVFYHDLSLTEAATVMNVSVGSARTHYDRGKKALKTWLTESKVFNESGLAREENQEAVR
ncbi:MAG: RNA polymerase [Blastocatellia bacterium AA13]|nr:MAG: RNA polymerase [Blastocatellia bacterium AA13]